jgi:predicted DCC family thiol-disulfide oxidoreductase YuxK/uncharacterized membrane protein YdjX (TVP38/TMEM64 family)
MRWLGRLGPLGPLAAFAIVVPPISGLLLLGTLHRVGPWLREHQELGVLLYLAAFTVLGGLALLPTYAQSLLGGWAFGFGAGLAAVLSGFVGAALFNYALAGRLSGDRLEAMLAESPRWDAVYRVLLRSSFWRALTILTLVRLPPNAPFAATNVALAAIRAPVVPFAIGTLAGLAPRATAVVYAGAGLSTLDFENPARAGWFLGGFAITVGVVVVLGLVARHALQRVDAQLASERPAGARRMSDGAEARDPVARARVARAPAVIFYDGDCGLCQRSIRMVARLDRAGRFRFAPLGGRTAAARLAGRQPAASASQTVLLLDGDRLSARSTAALHIVRELPWPWRALAVLTVVPRPLRDAVYDWIARRRYAWFGRADACVLPPADLRARLLD